MATKNLPMDQMHDSDSTEETGSADSPPADLVELVMRDHGVSREEAQRMIDESGLN